MATFAYSGRTRAGETVSGERAADTMDAAVAALRREQIMVTRITPAKAKEEAAAKKAVGKTGQEGQREEPRRLHPAVLRDDRRRPAARAVPRHSRQPGRGQELRGRHSADPHRRRVGRVAGRRDAQASEDVRPALHQHGRGGRGGRHPRHDSQAARDLHREGREAAGPGEVGDDLSDRRHRDRRRWSSASFSGRSSRPSRRCSRASAPSCRCRRASSSR